MGSAGEACEASPRILLTRARVRELPDQASQASPRLAQAYAEGAILGRAVPVFPLAPGTKIPLIGARDGGSGMDRWAWTGSGRSAWASARRASCRRWAARNRRMLRRSGRPGRRCARLPGRYGAGGRHP